MALLNGRKNSILFLHYRILTILRTRNIGPLDFTGRVGNLLNYKLFDLFVYLLRFSLYQSGLILSLCRTNACCSNVHQAFALFCQCLSPRQCLLTSCYESWHFQLQNEQNSPMCILWKSHWSLALWCVSWSYLKACILCARLLKHYLVVK